MRSALLVTIVTLSLSVLVSVGAGCAKPASAPASTPASDEQPPSGLRTKRALVLVDDDKKPEPPKERIDDQYSSKRIVEKVTAP
jgi:hypothetical protein